MRIGLTSLYSFRPHVRHLAFLAKILEETGHRTSFLVCDSSVPMCYARLLKGTGRAIECPKCVAGNFRSFGMSGVKAMNSRRRSGLPRQRLMEMARSSSMTFHRTETAADLQAPEVLETQEQLLPSVDIVYANTRDWIDEHHLDAVFLFNGRIDLTRAVVEAVKDAGLPFLACETPWYQHGLDITPNDSCLSLTHIRQLNRSFRDKPLTSVQARAMARLVSDRLKGATRLEWHVYNPKSHAAAWPASGSGDRVLILPSSRGELGAHPHWESKWTSYGDAMDAVFERLGIRTENCVLRGHPAWGLRFGQHSGARSERYYENWCRHRNIYMFPSTSLADTYNLIRAADLIVVNGGTAGFEGAMFGKPVICLGPAGYSDAGIALHVNGPEDLRNLDRLSEHDGKLTARRALRYLYTRVARHPQYVQFVRAETTTRFRYHAGASADRLFEMLRTGTVKPDDPAYCHEPSAETEVVDAMWSGRWESFAGSDLPWESLAEVSINRIPGLRWIDSVRDRLPKGHLGARR